MEGIETYKTSISILSGDIKETRIDEKERRRKQRDDGEIKKKGRRETYIIHLEYTMMSDGD